MIIDGVTYPGVIKEKEAAKKQYEKAVSRGQTAGLVRASGRKTEKFTVSVNVASESKVTFELVYEEMLKRHLGKYEMFIKVQPKTLVRKYEIEVDIHEPQGISFLDAQASFLTNDLLPAVEKSFSGEKGHVSFKPTIDQQRSCASCETTLLNGDFTVTYDVNRESPGNIQVVNGYFVHFFAPPKLSGVPKNVVYVIDRSGSMWGRKMEQTREALLRILNDTSAHDHFNFILFDNEIVLWKDSLIKATPENLEEAKQYVSTISPRGWTNINDPVLKAVDLLNKAHENQTVPERSVSMIILLTDGEANAGESNPSKIQENAKKAIQGRYTLYSLGFGYSVDYPFLEKLALENSGIARRIYEDSDADLQLKGFYNEIANPTLINIEMQYPENAVSDLTQNNFKHYYEGGEIVVAGRLTDNDLNSFIVDVKADGADKPIKYTENIPLQSEGDVSKKQEYIFGDFTERLWAYLTIQQLLEKRLYADSAEKANLTAQALDLSLKFKFVTPLTSMVVTKPEEKEKEEETLIADKLVEGQDQTDPFAATARLQTSSYIAPAQNYPIYSTPNFVDSDPHFVINVPQKDDALCFNIQEKPGVILNLIEDKQLGIAVNGQLIGNKKTSNSISNETYFGRIGIVNREMKIRIEVTTDTVTVQHLRNKKTFSWQQTGFINMEGFNLVVNKKSNVTFSFGEGATFVIILHEVWKDHPVHRDFLGFYTLDDHTFSAGVHGLLGQFFHGIDYEISNVHKTDNPDKPDATMKVKKKLLTVTRGLQRDYRKDHRDGIQIPCWFVHYNGEGLIDGTHTDYIVPDIFSISY
ncbi:inter-alpha-trypsin inhibitor heavy chain H3-like [Hyla sarda]|uniref:inter-alpha-trypsin inhibitor heavy chain H3-like n=1 Tax=Hyla sarda TaxID=327740 RepID=UPI0024C39302|nr:inter-alpha-trypsin inhibitor heavy chain H3-like [Hyla sarda]XP_056380144.1 inter-alpha-trypsin inhibitor heavy chain H3-like [Hyla sarda]XP_056380145.1 inter-alpha-trypsin inhibitor heavy chain H3-like [Hyla sarda]XP_056380146.1 inter-alpha-trypsin inhibitor heavy chain H3-like [Hyla sarda]XP_056380147.1 inter-alpha-trypsin inhibitor heavy chain H3-like [Hyla sarda]XP_056380148.1 inter-alpha-trypsin inhibitor heavy chain H3-like [Hyla sarda]